MPIDDFALVETLRWSRAQGYLRLLAHMRRLEASARGLGFCVDVSKVQADLADLANAHKPDTDVRVQALLKRDGALELGVEPLANNPYRPARVIVSSQRLDERDPLLGHKTTRRATHNAAAAEALEQGVDEVVLFNRRGQVADGARNTILVETADGFLTPPESDGALPGVLREILLAEGRARVARLTAADLSGARRLYLASSAHGLRPARLIG